MKKKLLQRWMNLHKGLIAKKIYRIFNQIKYMVYLAFGTIIQILIKNNVYITIYNSCISNSYITCLQIYLRHMK